MGAIVGDDGARYLFAAPEVRTPLPIKGGYSVEFEPMPDGQARDVFVKETAPSQASSRQGGYFDLGRVIQRTFTAISRNAAVFFGAGVVLVGAPNALIVFGQETTMMMESASGLFVIALGWVLNLIGAFLLQGMVVKAAVNGFNGKPTAFGDAFDAGVRVVLPLLGLAIVVGVGTFIGYVLLIIPGLILTVLWSVAAPAVVVERRGVFESLQRSRDLTRGHRWQVFGLVVIYAVLSTLISLLASGIGVAMGGSFATGAPVLWVNLLVGPVVSLLSAVVASAGVAALYYELRTTKEGVGPEVLAAVFD